MDYMVCRCVSGSHLLTAGSYVYNHYIDCVDTDYYLSSDIINSIISLPTRNPSGLVPVLACQDCALRVLKVSHTFLSCDLATPSG
jgi:Bardet-Biedl syndrome 7 protein